MRRSARVVRMSDITALLTRAPSFSRGEAAAHAIDDRELRRLVKAGAIVRLTRGWYAAADADRAAEATHRLRAQAVMARNSGRLRPSHHTALVMAGVTVHGVDLATVHVFAGTPRETDRGHGFVVHRPPPGAACTPDGNLCLAGALVQTGLTSGDRAFVVSADAALRSGLVTVDGLRAMMPAFAGHTGIAAVRRRLDMLDGGSESVGESLLRCDLHDLGREVHSQVPIDTTRGRYRVDFLLAGTRVVVEFDGVGKYDAGGAAFRAEKIREAALAEAGFVVVRFVWSDLGDLDLIQERLRQGVARWRRT